MCNTVNRFSAGRFCLFLHMAVCALSDIGYRFMCKRRATCSSSGSPSFYELPVTCDLASCFFLDILLDFRRFDSAFGREEVVRPTGFPGRLEGRFRLLGFLF